MHAELGHTDILYHTIETGDSCPIRQQPYRTPVVRREMMREMVESMQEQGVIQPFCSPWASPVVLVPKKDGTLRFCVDYRRLNAVTKKDVYPLPRVEDLLSSLGGAKYFTSLDLASGNWQVELDDDARQRSAFTTYNGLYEFVRMPFGLCNAFQPATKESPFFLLYGRDACIPTNTVLTHQRSPYAVDVADYKEDILSSLSAANFQAADRLESISSL